MPQSARRLAFVLAGLMILNVVLVLPVQAQAIRVLVDGEAVVFDQPPIVIGGRVLVPLRGIFERLGAFVQWDAASNTVIATRGDTQVRLTIGARQAFVNQRVVFLDVPALIVQGRTLVPLRFVSEAMGARVDWDYASRVVFITSLPLAQPAPPPPLPRPTSPPPPPPPPAPPSPPFVAVVEGIVFRVDLQVFPQRILVQRDTLIYTFLVTPDTAITRVDVTTNRSGPITLDQVRVGDLVRVTADTAGRAILIRVSIREVAGRIDAVTSRVIILDDGQTFVLGSEVRILIDGREGAREQLQRGMEVTVQLNPQTNEVVEVSARGLHVQPPPSPSPAVRITSLTHDAQRPLRAGERLTVSLRGTPGGLATFEIFGAASGVSMVEVSPGVYQGTYVVRSGDDVTEAAIFGRLRVGQVEAPLVQAGTPVTLDTLPPVITQRFPQPNSTVSNDRPNILITFADRGGAGTNTAAIRLFVNEQEVTARASVTEGAVAYSPSAPLLGQVSVRLLLVDRAGNAAEDRFGFTVIVAQTALIRGVTINPTTPLRPGDVLTVTMVGEPGGQAAFTITGLVTDVPMAESSSQSGVYIGLYRIRSGDVAQNARVTVRLAARGLTQQAEATTRVTILAQSEVPPPTVTSPAPGARVQAPIVIRGRAVPGYRVVVRVDYRGMFLVFVLQGTLGQFNTTADAAGNWTVTVDRPAPVSEAELTISATTFDPLGRESAPTVVKVVQNQ